MRKSAKWVLGAVLLMVVAAQFVRPDRSSVPVEPGQAIARQLEVPADVLHLLERACSDCHTQATQWPWYSNVAPVSWFVARHVDRGRRHLDLDRWALYGDYDAQKLLDQIAEEVLEERMPLPSYLTMHTEARLLASERRRIAAWARAERDEILARLQ